MSERISALLDGELADGEAGTELERIRESDTARESWNTYHLIGDALRGDDYKSYATRVAERLATEPTVLAPRAGRREMRPVFRYALSAAAAMGGVALVVWTAAPVLGPTPQAHMASAQNESNAHAAAKKHVENYLFAHQPASAMQAPNIQLVTKEISEPAR